MPRNCLTSLVCSVVLACSLVARGQDKSTTPSTHQCPAIVLTCPADPIDFGPPTEITAIVTGANPNTSLTYNWSVSIGAIVSGQNTPVVTIDTSSNPFRCLTVKLELGGFPIGCQNTAFCKRNVLGIADPVKFDEYGFLSFKKETLRLDNVAYQLKAEPRARLRIVGYDGHHMRRGTAMRRMRHARAYLVRRHGIESDRIVVSPDYIQNDSPETLKIELWVEPRWELISTPCT